MCVCVSLSVCQSVCLSICLSVLNDKPRCVSAVLSRSVPQLPVFPEQTGPRRVSRWLRKVREQGLLAGQEQVCWTVQSESVCEAEEVVKNRSVSVIAGQCLRLKRWSRKGVLDCAVRVSGGQCE